MPNGYQLINDSTRSRLEDSILSLCIPHDTTSYGSNPVHQTSTSDEFIAIFESVKEGIREGIEPIRIYKGSSGSYFCRDKEGQIVGVFKPKNEEPYGHLNPKWTKFIHRNLFPCCFGRECIIPNLGYISEAAASYLDQSLGLGIVPRTEIVKLASPAFHYSVKERWMHRLFKKPLPTKIGSFQLFLVGYQDSTMFFQNGYDRLNTAEGLENWTDVSVNDFKIGFEKLVILDYLIRNTDRGSDNWMIKTSAEPFGGVLDLAGIAQIAIPGPLSKPDPMSISESKPNHAVDIGGRQLEYSSSQLSTGQIISLPKLKEPEHIFPKHQPLPKIQNPTRVQIAAIDHGLAFPILHPNRVRSYPYGWLNLPIVHQPFSKCIADQYLPLLTNHIWWESVLEGLEKLSMIDKDFNIKMFLDQKALMRGQHFNLVDALSQSKIHPTSPYSLVQRPLVMLYVEDDDDDESMGSMVSLGRDLLRKPKNSLKKFKKRMEVFSQNACFSRC
jgi:hypothetical protein